MKSERRHELQTNTLARLIQQLPEFSSKHGGKILLVLIVIALAVVLYRQRQNRAQERVQLAWDNLSIARTDIDQLASRDPMQFTAPPALLAQQRTRLASDASDALDRVFKAADSRQLLAEAYIAEGDLNWQLASLPDLPGASTQPALRPVQSRDEYLKSAQKSYQTVIDQYADQSISLITARFGLAAVFENLGQFDQAKTQYEAVLQQPDAIKSFKDQATLRLSLLPTIQEPVYIAPSSTQPTTSK